MKKSMLIKVNGETIILKIIIKCDIKTLKSKSYGAMNLIYAKKKKKKKLELLERKVESKSPCQFIKPTC